MCTGTALPKRDCVKRTWTETLPISSIPMHEIHPRAMRLHLSRYTKIQEYLVLIGYRRYRRQTQRQTQDAGLKLYPSSKGQGWARITLVLTLL